MFLLVDTTLTQNKKLSRYWVLPIRKELIRNIEFGTFQNYANSKIRIYI